ncbi:Cullin [Fomitiporia mediterranea MF3/22]|uniref:Cullin n=1 Tax=Fomitiporia mediterranea (strain MF3/22) TaxID=694068 RepID=UPI000440778C|nr:Cullin [Fomitiporia mediterranea MF3/22]EJC98132.1 Cullin [Fomitiporia mediterranea MF3/22]
MLWILVEYFVQDLQKQFHLVSEEIETFLKEYETTDDTEVIKRLILRLAEWYNAWAPVPELGSLLHTTFNSEFQTHLFSSLPPSFPGTFKRLCESTVGAQQDTKLWTAFETLGLLDRYENLIASVCYERIEAHVQEICSGNWSEQMLHSLRSWMADQIVPWMILPYARGAKTHEDTKNMLAGIGTRFDYHVCKSLCELRTSEIFDIIVDYPESTPALVDLRDCLQRVDMRGELVSTLRRLNRKRLLHPGADTKDILTQYVSMIRCLRVIDPPGVLLHKVADPVRRYLRERPDTIRSIVASLVGEGGDLVDENEPPQPLQMQVEDYSDASWEPDPIDAGPEFRTNKPSDVISTLVSIYDSKDLFVKELQVLLAQRLLAITDGKFERERRNIEILKVRFGEAPLQVCEVMLRDMTESRRIDQHVQAQKPSTLHPTIISKHFWPALQVSKMKMPGQFKEVMEEYSKEFALFKQDKRLRFLPQLGTVDLSIELSDRTVDVTVPPLEAAVIELFSGKDTWSVDELSNELHVESAAVRKGLDTWVDHGVLSETDTNVFVLLEEAGSIPLGSNRGGSRHGVIEEQEPVVSPAQQQEAEQMRVYWKFIEGMLTNIGALPLDRIQTMLKFAPNYSRTIEQLSVFMEAARREGLVTVNNGLWKLNR